MDWMKKMLAMAGFATAVAMGPALLVGCDDSDDPADAIGDAADDAADNMEDAADDVGDGMEDAVD